MREKRKYRVFTPEQKAEIVLAGLRGDRSVRDVCREYEIVETLYYQWRDRLLEGGKNALATPREKPSPEAQELAELKKKVGQLERALGRKTYELEIAGELSRDWEETSASPGPAHSWPRATASAVVARVAKVSRQALYRRCGRRPTTAGPSVGRPGDEAIVQVAKANPVDGTRMVAALASRELGKPVNRKRVQRVMRAHGLLQRSRNGERRRGRGSSASPARTSCGTST
ncbi:transposase [Motilibacter deserti]|uniref:Transposase n=1 Tax=Motilibacter deserti TaxID=2714956 RepID=A0ABX0H214_9ACTN|nr:transposase [Motilibacter deserti]NHC16089.1 transposase [Motilibacter deserti]